MFQLNLSWTHSLLPFSPPLSLSISSSCHVHSAYCYLRCKQDNHLQLSSIPSLGASSQTSMQLCARRFWCLSSVWLQSRSCSSSPTRSLSSGRPTTTFTEDEPTAQVPNQACVFTNINECMSIDLRIKNMHANKKDKSSR